MLKDFHAYEITANLRDHPVITDQALWKSGDMGEQKYIAVTTIIQNPL